MYSAIILLRADAIHADGICEPHSCVSTETLAPRASVGNGFGLIYTFANSDRYRGTGTIGDSNNSDTTDTIEVSAAEMTVTFLGNASGTSSSADTLTIDFLQYLTLWRGVPS